MSEHFRLVLQSSYMLAPAVRHMVFAREDGLPLAFIAGQFVQIHFAGAQKPLRRSYSIATIPKLGETSVLQVEMAVSYVEGGAATALLSNLQLGESIEASGPYGRFCLHEADTNQRYLLIATGTGVTPYRAMLPLLKQAIEQRGVQVNVVFGARNSAELLYGDEFAAFAEQVPGFRFFACFSRELREPARTDDRSGYVQALLPSLIPNAENDIAYLCGNPDMVDACFELLKNAGLPTPHIRREKYISPK